MPRSKYVWLIVFENGSTQYAKAQTINQILCSEELICDSDSIVNIEKMKLDDSDDYKDAIDIPFSN